MLIVLICKVNGKIKKYFFSNLYVNKLGDVTLVTQENIWLMDFNYTCECWILFLYEV